MRHGYMSLLLAPILAVTFLLAFSGRASAAGDREEAMMKTLLQMAQDHKMHERYYTVRDLKSASELRFTAMRLQTVAERLAKVTQKEIDAWAAGTKSTMEENAPLSIGQMEIINYRDTVPYTAILWYGHGGEPIEIKEIRAQLAGSMVGLRNTGDMLIGYMNKHFGGEEAKIARPDRRYLDASLWRTRLTVGLYTVATYYKLAGELIGMALKTFDKAPLAGRDLIKEDKRTEAVLMLDTTAKLLNEAARFQGMAGTELGDDEERWQQVETALYSVLGRGR